MMKKNSQIMKRTAIFATLFATSASLAGCGAQNRLQTSQVLDDLPGTSAASDICVSIEGNGENFSSHIGAFIAMLEQGQHPKVITGGSSGAVAAALVRALLSNPSVVGTSATDGKPISKKAAQNAALVLAASQPIFESLIFLPALDDIVGTAASLLYVSGANALNQGYASNPDFEAVHGDSLAAQALLGVQFLSSQDFGPLLAKEDFHKRVEMLGAKWRETFDFMRVTPEDLVNALLTPNSQLEEGSIEALRFKEIRKRYFALFERTHLQNNRKTASERLLGHEKRLERLKFLYNDGVRSGAQRIYDAAMETLSGLPFVGALSSTVGKPFLLPSTKALAWAIKGKDLKGNRIEIPKGVIVHTTARLGEKRLNIPGEGLLFPQRRHQGIKTNWFTRIDDKPGFESLYQLYIAGPDLLPQLFSAQDATKDNGGLLSYLPKGSVTDQKLTVLASAAHAQPIGGLDLFESIAYTISEPGFFRRIPLNVRDLQTADSALLTPELRDPKAFLISYGGWLDTSASQTLAKITDCDPDQVDRFAFLHPNRVENPFQESCIQETANCRTRKRDRVDVDVVMRKLRDYLLYSRSITAKESSFDLNWDWDNPITDDNNANLKLKQSRSLYLFAAYTSYRRTISRTLQSDSGVLAFGRSPDGWNQQILDGKIDPSLVKEIYGNTGAAD